MAAGRHHTIDESILDRTLSMSFGSAHRVTRDWLQVKAAGQLRCRFRTATQWREGFAAESDERKRNDDWLINVQRRARGRPRQSAGQDQPKNNHDQDYKRCDHSIELEFVA